MIMKVVKQLDGWSCMACVAAMITGETLREVIEFIGHDGSATHPKSVHPQKYVGFTEYEIVQYLLSCGYYYGSSYASEPPKHFKENFLNVNPLDVNNCTAMLVVTSENLKGCTHSILLHQGKIYDPDPNMNGTKIEDYEVHIITPIEQARPGDKPFWKKRNVRT